MRQTDPNKSP